MIYDISPLISARLQVWPGDVPLLREVSRDMKHGDDVTLSSLRATVHLGAHADAPCHIEANAPAIDARSLDYYLGPCQVIRISMPARGRMVPEMLEETDITLPRVLFATGTYLDSEKFNRDFAALSPELIPFLHGKGVKLVGIDTPSVDLFDSDDLAVHRLLVKHDMAILEGLVLRDVPEGTYELIALPLKLADFDASPVRAILRRRGAQSAEREAQRHE